MITTTFTPATTNDDTLAFPEVAANDGVYGSGSEAPEFFSLGGNVFKRDATTGAFGGEVSDDGVRKFRRIPGQLEIAIA